MAYLQCGLAMFQYLSQWLWFFRRIPVVRYRVHLSSQAYSQYENDRRTPDLETALRLAQYYDVTLEYLIAGEGLFETGIRPHLNESVTNLPPEAIDELLIFFDYLRYKYKSDGLYTSQE